MRCFIWNLKIYQLSSLDKLVLIVPAIYYPKSLLFGTRFDITMVQNKSY